MYLLEPCNIYSITEVHCCEHEVTAQVLWDKGHQAIISDGGKWVCIPMFNIKLRREEQRNGSIHEVSVECCPELSTTLWWCRSTGSWRDFLFEIELLYTYEFLAIQQSGIYDWSRIQVGLWLPELSYELEASSARVYLYSGIESISEASALSWAVNQILSQFSILAHRHEQRSRRVIECNGTEEIDYQRENYFG